VIVALCLPLSFLILQYGIYLLFPESSAFAAYLAMVLAPLLAGLACFHRARRESAVARAGWISAGIGLQIWACGAAGNLWQEWVLGNVNEMYRSSMLAFNLSSVPVVFLLASLWRAGNPRAVRIVDAALAIALGLVYFLCTWAAIQASARPDEPGVTFLVWLIDAQNLYVTAGAGLRWMVAQERKERSLFKSLFIHLAVLSAIVFLNDHVFAGDPAFGPEYGAIVTAAFALLAYFALAPAGTARLRRVNPSFARTVRAASPIMLAGALMIAALVLIRFDYAWGLAGVACAVVGYSARTLLAHRKDAEHHEALRRRQNELQAVAWTDALTGLANRHFLDQSFRRAWRDEMRSGRSLSVLMIDIDHFKLLNDRYGHPAGDACLRAVAQALQTNLVRPEDIVARYGGEEFIALLQGVDMEGAKVVAERLRGAVRDLGIENLGSPVGVLTVSIGVASGVLDGEVFPQHLIEIADKALYDAKMGGRDQVRSPAGREG
jgi:diguanylate cyclase (GGDEF)-like protein